MIPKIKKVKLNSIVLFNANITLTIVSNVTMIIVGISIHLLSKGFLSAINNNIPQEKATADMRPLSKSILRIKIN
jgi:hypothetical protein